MTHRAPPLLALLNLAFIAGIAAEPSPLALSFEPRAALPLGQNAELFAPGGGGALGLEYSLTPRVSLQGAIEYDLAPYLVANSGSLSLLGLRAGAAYSLPLLPSLAARAFASGGIAYGFENGSAEGQGPAGGSALPTIGAGLGLDWAISPTLSLRLDAGYQYRIGLLGAASLASSLAVKLPRAATGPAQGLKLLRFENLSLGNLFPVFHAWYDENPVGTVTVVNAGRKTATDVNVSFVVKQYMDGAKACATIASLAPGERREVKLYALLNGSILDVTEQTKATAEVMADYRSGEDTGSQSVTASATVYDRNAMTWDDDRRAAAFVSGKDPWVLALSNQVMSIVKNLRNPGIDKTLQTAIAFHDALRLYGLSYATSPSNPFAERRANHSAIDFLKFPRQTLSYKAGDCADLSILYASLFESIGAETAFITVPGHILMAVALDMPADQASSRLSGWGDLVITAGKAWVPIETTMRDADFFAAWREGSREWKAASAAKTAAFYPLAEAWKDYQPVGLPADNSSVTVPDPAAIAASFARSLATLIEGELAARVIVVNKTMNTLGQTPKALNDRGVIYASFGRYELARADFKAATSKGDYLPALVNLGNVAYLSNDAKGAYEAYQQALKLTPKNTKLLANFAKAAAALGKADEANTTLDAVRALDPALASQVAQAVQGAASGTRAAESGTDELNWIQE